MGRRNRIGQYTRGATRGARAPLCRRKISGRSIQPSGGFDMQLPTLQISETPCRLQPVRFQLDAFDEIAGINQEELRLAAGRTVAEDLGLSRSA